MKIIASELESKLQKLNTLVSAKGLVENCDKFVFSKNRIYSFNGEVFISVLFQHDLDGSVEGASFYKIIKKFGSSKISIVEEEGVVVVSKGRSKSRFSCDKDYGESPVILDGNDCFVDVSEKFLPAVNTCSYTCGNDYTDLRTVVVHCVGSVVESSDSFRVTRCLIDADYDEFFIPIDAVKFLNKSNPTKISIGADWIRYKSSDGTLLCHRTISFPSEYPDLGVIIESGEEYHEIELPGKLYDSLGRAQVFIDSKSEVGRFVTIQTKSGKVKVTAKGNSGSYSDTLKSSFDDAIKFVVNPTFLMEVIEKTSTVRVNETTLRIDLPEYQYLACLARGE